MTERKWGAIASGAEFEAMVTTIVFFEDPRAALFGRRGKDGGQDARSGDGALVYQAKFHESESAAKAIADAKREAAKILDYRQPGHARHDQWQGVTAWRLVTNATFNPTNRETWIKEVVPLFASQGLTADYWECATLQALLNKHPEVRRAYFQDETRAFLSLPEVLERLPLEEPFLQRPELAGFVGRNNEVAAIQNFLASTALFLVVHGAGGVGKTRLLVEAGERIAAEGAWQVLWANIESMSATGSWFQAIDPARPTLLLVDEPQDEELLRILAEQLGGRSGRRTSAWKIAVAVRSPKDPVLRFLRGPRLQPRVRELPIDPLPRPDAEEMCLELLRVGFGSRLSEAQRAGAARQLASHFGQNPVWMTLAVHLLDLRGDLSRVPETAQGLADMYLEEIFNSQKGMPPKTTLAVIRWIALLGTISRRDEATIKAIGEQSGVGGTEDLLGLLAGLVACRALIQRGANNRLVELKPDVLRDHVLRNWLTVRVGDQPADVRPSNDALEIGRQIQNLTRDKGLNPLVRAMLASLARTEFLLRAAGHDVPLLNGFFEGFGEEAIQAMRASQRMAIAEALTAVAAARPLNTARVIQTMRVSTAPDEVQPGLFRPQTIGQRDVVRSLAWPLFHAATGAATHEEKSLVLNELSALVEAEADDAESSGTRLPNDGKRAAALTVRTLEGGPQFVADFDAVAMEMAEQFIDHLRRQPPTPGAVALVKAIVYYLVSVERRQTWAEEGAVHFQSAAILPGHPGWAIRERLLASVKDAIVAVDTPPPSRVILWDVMTAGHRSLCQAWMNNPDPTPVEYSDALLNDLQWAEQALGSRETDVAELAAARDLWQWHYKFDETPAPREVAGRLEQLYAQDSLAGEFEPLLAWDNVAERIPRGAAKAAGLAAAGSAAEIHAFVERAIRFVGSEQKLYEFAWIARALGGHAVDSAVVRQYIFETLSAAEVSPRSDLAALAAEGWFAALRRSGAHPAVNDLLQEMLARCGSDRQKVNLLICLYAASKNGDSGAPGPEELQVLCEQEQLFLDQGKMARFVEALGHWVFLDWPLVTPIIDRLLTGMTAKDAANAAVVALTDAVFSAVRAGPRDVIPKELGTWLLDQVAKVPEVADVGGHLRWYLEEILKTADRPSIAWLARTIAARGARERAQTGEPFRALNGRERLSEFVAKVASADAAPEVLEAIRSLVGMLSEQGTIGYYLPPFLKDIDPQGLLIPAEIARRVDERTTADELSQLARVAVEYGVGTAAWRTIAKPILDRTSTLGEKERPKIFASLAERALRFWGGTYGEVAPIFVEAVKVARDGLESEAEAVFHAFWKWRLAIAEAELDEQEQQAKEERGE